jgi:cytochrome aa3-600 menaquinol oxidase subunit II
MKVNKKGTLLAGIGLSSLFLGACDRLMVLDPAGPQAARQAHDIMLSIYIMAGIVLVVLALLVFMLVKYRASKMSADYEPPHMHGNWLVETICIGVPIIIVIILSVVSVKSNYIVESAPEEFEDQAPLIIYAQASNWKWHFSYPEQGIETVNYLYIPTNRNIEFKLYSNGPITSFWIPQLGGQKYAMADMVTTLHLAADTPGEYFGRNANFSGAGFAENTFLTTAMSQAEFDEWVEEVHATAKPITQETYEKLLEPGHLGTSTYTGTHLEFAPAPEHNHEGLEGPEDESSEHDNH